jgi:hypothetical protein
MVFRTTLPCEAVVVRRPHMCEWPIFTRFVAVYVNQVISKRFCKKQQMARTHRGAPLLLRIRTRVLNGDWEATFREWYPGFRAVPQQVAA